MWENKGLGAEFRVDSRAFSNIGDKWVINVDILQALRSLKRPREVGKRFLLAGARAQNCSLKS
jgi:hypothetical protein